MTENNSGWRKRQIALDKKAENARELGLDYEPAGGTQVSKVWWDGEKLMAKPIPLEDVYQPAPVQDIDWKDMYEKEKRRSEMWIAKYEKDIGLLEKAGPVAAPVQEPVAWRGHVEQRIRTWRQRTMNKSGDMLAIDDFMGQDSIDDLVDFVCDEWVEPAAQPALKPLTDEQISQLWLGTAPDFNDKDFARAIEAAHGIKENT